MLFYATVIKGLIEHSICRGPKRLQPQHNKHVHHGKWQQENLLVSALTTDEGWGKETCPLGTGTIKGNAYTGLKNMNSPVWSKTPRQRI